MTAQTLTLTDLPKHPELGWAVDPETGTVYGAAGRWAGRKIGRIGSHGYPVSTISGRAYLHHRVIWEACVGPIPPRMVVNHKNGIKTDNRLENLEVVTSAQNNQHAFDTGLRSGGGVRGPRNANYKVTPALRHEILLRLAAGETGASIARHLSMSEQTIWRVKWGKR